MTRKIKKGDKVRIKKCGEWIPGTIIELTLTGAHVEVVMSGKPFKVWRLRKSIREAVK